MSATMTFRPGQHCEVLYVNRGTFKKPGNGIPQWRRIVVESVHDGYIKAKDKDKGEAFRSFRLDCIQDVANYPSV